MNKKDSIKPKIDDMEVDENKSKTLNNLLNKSSSSSRRANKDDASTNITTSKSNKQKNKAQSIKLNSNSNEKKVEVQEEIKDDSHVKKAGLEKVLDSQFEELQQELTKNCDIVAINTDNKKKKIVNRSNDNGADSDEISVGGNDSSYNDVMDSIDDEQEIKKLSKEEKYQKQLEDRLKEKLGNIDNDNNTRSNKSTEIKTQHSDEERKKRKQEAERNYEKTCKEEAEKSLDLLEKNAKEVREMLDEIEPNINNNENSQEDRPDIYINDKDKIERVEEEKSLEREKKHLESASNSKRRIGRPITKEEADKIINRNRKGAHATILIRTRTVTNVEGKNTEHEQNNNNVLKHTLEKEQEIPEIPSYNTSTNMENAYLVLNSTGEIVEITTNNFLIGKTNSCDYFLDEYYVSRRHALISCSASNYYIEDLGSTNGTFVNNVKVANGKKIRLLSGDEIKLANIRFKIVIE